MKLDQRIHASETGYLIKINQPFLCIAGVQLSLHPDYVAENQCSHDNIKIVLVYQIMMVS